jgi:hypothetical protein
VRRPKNHVKMVVNGRIDSRRGRTVDTSRRSTHHRDITAGTHHDCGRGIDTQMTPDLPSVASEHESPGPIVNYDIGRHLEFIQAIVTRMASNSFLLKSWSVGLSAALFAAGAKEGSALFPLVALGPACAFWGLDAYYLRQERLYRRLYEDARGGALPPFSLDTTPYTASAPSWPHTLRAPAVLGVHGGVVFAILAVVALITFG